MLSAVLLLSVGGTSIVAATTDTDKDLATSMDKDPAEEETTGIDVRKGKGTWTVVSVDVHKAGSWSSGAYSNVKKTNSYYASFNGDAIPAALGYKVRLVNNANVPRSNMVGLYLNSTANAGNNSWTIN